MTVVKENLKYDLKSSLVIFLIALPLCIGIAVASQTPVISGLIAGIIGGIVTGFFSRSQVSVSGPAAGMVVVVISTLTYLGGFPALLLALFISGIIQIIFGLLKLGEFGNYIPTSVIKGMLSGIGIIFIIKQIPHLFGYDSGDFGDHQLNLELFQGSIHYGAIIIGIISLSILWLSNKIEKRNESSFLSYLPAPVIVVAVGIIVNKAFALWMPQLFLDGSHVVNINYRGGFAQFLGELTFPDWSQLSNSKIYFAALFIALITSIESLLNIEASDRADVFKRYTSKNRELVAQGIGNSLSGLCGGLPITSVVVRTNLNINSGARSKLSTIFHGVWLLIAALFLANFLGVIPVASISAILLSLGWKMASLKTFKKIKQKGRNQFVPFVVTVLGIVLLNILWGVLIGLFVSSVYILKSKSVKAMVLVNEGNNYLLQFYKDVSFLNKPILTRLLKSVPAHSKLFIDGGQGTYIDADIIDLLEDFLETAKMKHINVEVKKTPLALNSFFKG